MSIIEIAIDAEIVGETARQLSLGNATWDECNWLFAEGELRLYPAYSPRPKSPLIGGLPDRVQLQPTKIVPLPKDDEVRALAWDISERHYSLSDLHWFIAQRYFVYGAIKASKAR